MVGFVVLGLIGPYIAPNDPQKILAGPQFASPTWDFPFVTAQFGEDMFSRVIAGARISLTIAVASLVFGAGVGSFLGILSGYAALANSRARWIDYAIQRSGEAFTAFPFIVFYLMLITAFGQSIETIVIAIAIGGLFGGSRVLRSSTMIESQMQYVSAAHSVGASEVRIFFRHVIPNVMPLTIVLLSTSLGGIILAESALAFLGIGLEPGTPSWGIDIFENVNNARLGKWWLVTFPAIAISLVVLGSNPFGDAMRDVWDPRLRE